MYRVYCDGRGFGIDYSRADAIRVAAEYRAYWKGHHYYVRKAAR